jgi:hypothetical protein
MNPTPDFRKRMFVEGGLLAFDIFGYSQMRNDETGMLLTQQGDLMKRFQVLVPLCQNAEMQN